MKPRTKAIADAGTEARHAVGYLLAKHDDLMRAKRTYDDAHGRLMTAMQVVRDLGMNAADELPEPPEVA